MNFNDLKDEDRYSTALEIGKYFPFVSNDVKLALERLNIELDDKYRYIKSHEELLILIKYLFDNANNGIKKVEIKITDNVYKKTYEITENHRG